MSTRAHLYRAATDNVGNVIPNLQVAVWQAGTSTPITVPIYADGTSGTTLPNPFVTSSGVIDLYLATPQSVAIALTAGGVTTVIDHIEIAAPPENTVQAVTGFAVTNTPSAGQFLECVAPGQASWVNADSLVSTQASPLATLLSYDPSGSTLGSLVAQDSHGVAVAPTYADTTGDTLPPGYAFTRALRFPTADRTIIWVPPQTFAETGALTFAYKIVAAASGVGAATVRAAVDASALRVQMPTDPQMINIWSVGYLGDIPPGTHAISLEQLPGADTTSYVEFGPIYLRSGNNIPFHTHQGAGADSTVLGPGATATFDRSVVVGGGALALGVDATALGYAASAEAQGLALGATAYAAVTGVAIGFGARTTTGTVDGVAIGTSAVTTADEAVAIGLSAAGQGARSLALGVSTVAAGAESVAIGSTAQALADESVALGAGALTGSTHTGSFALGPGAQTTAANQAMLGAASTTVLVPGSLTQTGPSAVIGGATSVLGFYGATGTVRPTVIGSRNGHPVLTALLSALQGLGLVIDGTVA